MSRSATARKLLADFDKQAPKLGDLKKLGKEIKQDHELAMELWASESSLARLLSTLILDRKQLNQSSIEQLAEDLSVNDETERTQIADWLLANQLLKTRKLVTLVESWRDHESAVLRRCYWYHEARRRWMGNTPPPDNSAQLLDVLESEMGEEIPEVQWAMNFCACQIGVFESKLRSRCVRLGKQLQLYKDDPVSRNCTPAYLPEFIRIEVAKRK